MITNDIAVVWDNDLGQGNWQVLNNDLVLDNALHSAVMVSLFTDRLAPLEPSADEARSAIGKVDGDRRGWWGDMLRDESMGSRLWQLRRAVKVDQNMYTIKKIKQISLK